MKKVMSYEAPIAEVIEMSIENVILAGSNFTGETPAIDGEDDFQK